MQFAARKSGLAILAYAAIFVSRGEAQDDVPRTSSAISSADRFQADVKPLLVKYCYDCHGDGLDEGGRAFDVLEAEGDLLENRELWAIALKKVRAGVMPPDGARGPNADELAKLEGWVKQDVFHIDYEHPDPGHVVLRRLNRTEYQNTIRDLMNVDFDATESFPPDDAGYGFDNIADVLTVSPLLLEKYLNAAETIVASSAPKVSRVMDQRVIFGDTFRSIEGIDEFQRGDNNDPEQSRSVRINFNDPATMVAEFEALQPGHYEIDVTIRIRGSFDFSPQRSRVRLSVNDDELYEEIYVWEERENHEYHFERDFEPGVRQFKFDVTPVEPDQEATGGRAGNGTIHFMILDVKINGPVEHDRWIKPANYDLFYHRDLPPETSPEREQYAGEVLQNFATRAFRRPVDDATVDRLVALASSIYQEPDKTFEEGIARAMVAVLASPRFLYKVEESAPLAEGDVYTPIDEYALASRLSYFLWSTMPDEELFTLAKEGRLRVELDSQIDRMLQDPRSIALTTNFAGQWLRSREVDHVMIDATSVVLADLEPVDEEDLPAAGRGGRGGRGRGQAGRGRGRGRGGRGSQFPDFNARLRTAMRQETELHFDYIMRNDRTLLEMIDADYAFLNQQLAELYGIEGVEGNEMRLVELPEDSPRGGILTQGAMLTVTSNPTRTSPVKRGLYVLQNILGTPPAAPPPKVPELEASGEKFAEGETPSLRQLLEVHREDPLCSSCHGMMDPLGLALENFNALGMWRDKEGGVNEINPAGRLISGDTFQDINELKAILIATKHQDFYRCVTEKMLTYALGRGVEDYDTHTVDLIVEQLEETGGQFSALLKGVIHSAPFQLRRTDLTATAAN